MAIKKATIACPSCGKKGTWILENSDRPFCSPRCKLIDLGGWASERHRIPGAAVTPEDNRVAADVADEHGKDEL